jgi:galactose-1-phosphate uridylyltransferase
MTINACLNHKKISSYKQSVIQTFFNIGERSGASIPHLHGQTVLFWNRQDGGIKSKTYKKSSKSTPNGCTKCELWLNQGKSVLAKSLNLQERIIVKNAHWMAFLAYAPEKDAQIRILPKRHISAFWDLKDEELTDLVPVLIKSNQMLTNFINAQGGKYQLVRDRNILIRQFLQDNDSDFHMFIDILPVQQLGGAEASDNQKFSCIFPETIAKIMRDKHLYTSYG